MTAANLSLYLSNTHIDKKKKARFSLSVNKNKKNTSKRKKSETHIYLVSVWSKRNRSTHFSSGTSESDVATFHLIYGF